MKGKEKSLMQLPETEAPNFADETSVGETPVEKAKAFSGEEKRHHRKSIAFIAAIVILGGIAVCLLFDINKDVNSYTFEESGYQYYAGAVSKVEAGETITRQDGQDTTDSIVNLPVYCDSGEVFFPQSSVYYPVTDRDPLRLDYFSRIFKENGGLMLVKDDQKIPTERGFLFDGNNLYFFAEPMLLKYNGYELELGIFSYIEADFNNGLMIYNTSSSECTVENVKGSVTAYPKDKAYELSLLSDSIIYKNGDKELLFTRNDLLDSVFEN